MADALSFQETTTLPKSREFIINRCEDVINMGADVM